MCLTPMHVADALQLLVLAAAEDGAAAWQLPGMQATRAADLDALTAALVASHWDCVILDARQSVTAAALNVVRSACDEAEVPMALAGAAGNPGVPSLLDGEHFDGFVDEGWPQGLRQAVIQAMLRRYQLGPSVARFQRTVLEATKQSLASLEQLAFHDDLTQLHNLRFFREVLAKEHARCARHGGAYALIYLDLDGLRAVNASHGHLVGSHVLTCLGAAIAAVTRASDYAFRVGGDEFTVLLVECDREGARALAERLTARIRQTPINVPGGELHVTASAGVASFPEDGTSAQEVLARADQAVFRAKQAGRDRVVLCDPTCR